MENKRNKYSIRKFAVGASSILIGSLLFLNVETVKAAEENNQSEANTQVQSGNHLGDDEHQNLVNDNINTPVNDDKTQVNDEKDNQATHTSLHKDQQDTHTKVNDSTDKVDPEFNAKDKEQEQDQAEVDPEFNAKDKEKEQDQSEVDPEFNAKDKVKEQDQAEVDPEFNAKDKVKEQDQSEVDPEFNAKDKVKEQDQAEVDPEFNAKDKVKEQDQSEVDPEFNAKDKVKEQNQSEVDPEFNAKDRVKEQDQSEVDPEYNAKDRVKEQNQSEVDPEYNATDKVKEQDQSEVDPEFNAKDRVKEQAEVEPEYNAKDKVKEQDQSEVEPEYNATDKEQENHVDYKDANQNKMLENSQPSLKERVKNDNNIKEGTSFDKLPNQTANHDSKQDNENNPDKALNTLKENAVATPKNQTQQNVEKANEQPNKAAKQGQYKNQDPIILVHGFNGFTDDNNPAVLAHYWGGDKLNIRQDLESNGYETYEASVGALSSNYDRAVELYYYIKGGTVDYGAAHAEKYGHERYGKTYEGVYKDWQPGKKVHLVAHSMGGQTVRQLEELLRNGNQEEIEYQKEHGGEISPLFQGNNDNMVNSITTIGTPHNGTHAADALGNEALVRQLAFDYAKFKGNKNSKVDFGFGQWGLKQREGETYAQYVQRVQNSGLWKTEDNGFYDLTREGAAKLNKNTSLNPNIVYKTYTGESTRPTLFGNQKSDVNLFLPFTVTGNVIGKAAEKEWRENDGLVSTISSQHPFNQAFIEATDEVKKGVWQVTPIKHGWDHVDFVGQDSTDSNRPTEELQQFWHNLAEDLVRNEQFDA
ncbi:YSIRK-targeted triacylglycerol lipase [Staphylococcus xylosus]|uniref:YSIRK-targeted triacylglycerol lipase n=1 Tax=Staphylococcus xylosus TaxID=1288 RepID=UPI000E691778|nr:YSIRK-type signal peptide-containing protein [Staphylococcus xylosus]RIM65640.1 YSIRK-type signal peptide-containing protein [Staphylococcus xylosus]